MLFGSGPDALPVLVVAVPLFVAALLAATTAFLPRRVPDTVTAATLVGMAGGLVRLLARTSHEATVTWFGGWEPRDGVSLGISFVVEPFGAGLALFVSVLGLAALVYTWRYFDSVGGLFHVLLLVFLAGMIGFCLSGDLFNMFVFFELMSVPAFALTGYKIEETAPLQGALNFAVTNSVGALLVLWGIGLLYARTGALNLAQIGESLAAHPPDGLVVAAGTLVLTGFLIKAATVPFHFWLADAHAVAPVPICVLFSGVMVTLGVFGAARVYWTVFDGVFHAHIEELRVVLTAAGLVTMVVGAVLCFAQRHLKRLLAMSTVSHGGVLVVGFGLLTPPALSGSAVYLLGHGLVKASLFMCAGVVLHRLGDVDEGRLWGRGKSLRSTGLLFLVGVVALAGLPPFGTFLGKFLIEEEALHAGFGWIKWPMIATSAVTGGAALRAAARIFLGLGDEPPRKDRVDDAETETPHEHTPAVMWIPAVLLLTGALALSFISGLGPGAEAAAEHFTDRHAYAGAVLEGETIQLPEPPGGIRPTSSTYLYGLIVASGAVGAATLALWRRRLPESVRALGRRFRSPLEALHALHSGQVGDYVAWLALGCAVLGAALAAALL